MEPKLSRKKARRAGVLLMAAVLGLLAGIVILNAALMAVMLLFAIAASFIAQDAFRCPNCGAYFRGLHPSRENEGFCRVCGRLMQYDTNGE